MQMEGGIYGIESQADGEKNSHRPSGARHGDGNSGPRDPAGVAHDNDDADQYLWGH